MVAQAVTRAWLISRQQSPPAQKNPGKHFGRDETEKTPKADRREMIRDDLDEDAIIRVEKRGDVVPLRRGPSPEVLGDDGFWSSHLFWKGIVFGVLAVVFIKTIFDIQAPFGIDWYDF